MERRYGQRRTSSLTVTLRTKQGVAVEGQVSEISSSGALVAAPWPAKLNSQVLLQFRVHRSNSKEAAAWAEVIRRAPNGFAVEWEEFSPPVVRAILRELRSRTTGSLL
jgi:hypothetical protein